MGSDIDPRAQIGEGARGEDLGFGEEGGEAGRACYDDGDVDLDDAGMN